MTLEQTAYTPMIDFNNAEHTLYIKGKSNPENAFEFYAEVNDWVEKYFLDNVTLIISLELIYMNSASWKSLCNLLDILEEKILEGKVVKILWLCNKENYMMEEAGVDLKEDFNFIKIIST
jgi:hypothetical protein